jgi:predicted amidohydrolase YtcJ
MADADLLLVGATLRPEPPGRDAGADAVAVQAGRITAIGRRAELAAIAAARTIDLGGRVLAPGFIDAHNHLLFASLFARQLDCRAPLGASLDALLARIAAHANASDDDAWLRAWGFAPYRLRERRAPTRAELDAACPVRPLVVLHVSGHTAQVNSAGLRRLGIAPATPDPPGGRIERDADGEPTGVLHETAMQAFSLRALARDLLARPLDEQVDVIAGGAAAFAALGLTTSCDALSSPALIALYREVARRGRLPCNVVAMPFHDWTDGPPDADPDAPAGRVRAGAIKLFGDGSLSGCTAAVSTPYEGTHDHGILHRDQHELDAIIAALAARGHQIAIHAIGDRAVAQALRAYARVIGPHGNHRRHRLEHVGVVTPALVAELARLDVVVATQPRMLFEQGDAFARACGLARLPSVYPYRTLIDAGLHVAGSSDCPVVSADPILGMRDAMLRRTEEGRTLAPAERLDPRQALRMWTEEAAYALFMEDERGALAVGRAADLVVLSADPWTTPPDAWGDALRVERTIVAGEIVFALE